MGEDGENAIADSRSVVTVMFVSGGFYCFTFLQMDHAKVKWLVKCLSKVFFCASRISFRLSDRPESSLVVKPFLGTKLHQIILPVGAGNQTDSDWSKSRPMQIGSVKPMTDVVVSRQPNFFRSHKNFGLHGARPLTRRIRPPRSSWTLVP
jgi:hypothetical protein